jgi:hypothetical protein
MPFGPWPGVDGGASGAASPSWEDRVLAWGQSINSQIVQPAIPLIDYTTNTSQYNVNGFGNTEFFEQYLGGVLKVRVNGLAANTRTRVSPSVTTSVSGHRFTGFAPWLFAARVRLDEPLSEQSQCWPLVAALYNQSVAGTTALPGIFFGFDGAVDGGHILSRYISSTGVKYERVSSTGIEALEDFVDVAICSTGMELVFGLGQALEGTLTTIDDLTLAIWQTIALNDLFAGVTPAHVLIQPELIEKGFQADKLAAWTGIMP